MGTENTLFAGQNDEAPQQLTGEDALKALVGEGQKYTSVEELAKAALHAQKHIEKLEQEAKELRDQTLKAKGVDDILAALQGNAAPDGRNPQDQDPAPAGPDADVSSLVAAEFEKRDAAARKLAEDANLQQVVKTLGEKYGAKAGEVYAQTGQQLQINLDELARKSPAAVLKLVADARPAPGQGSQLPVGTRQSPLSAQSGVLGKAAIKAMYDNKQINRHEKITLENKMYSQLGADVFNAN